MSTPRKAKKRPSKARYKHRKIAPKRKFDPRSIRTIKAGKRGAKLIIGCPMGKYAKGRCRVGTRAIAELKPKKKKKPVKRRNPRTSFQPAAIRVVGIDKTTKKIYYYTVRNSLNTIRTKGKKFFAENIARHQAEHLALRYPEYKWGIEIL